MAPTVAVCIPSSVADAVHIVCHLVGGSLKDAANDTQTAGFRTHLIERGYDLGEVNNLVAMAAGSDCPKDCWCGDGMDESDRPLPVPEDTLRSLLSFDQSSGPGHAGLAAMLLLEATLYAKGWEEVGGLLLRTRDGKRWFLFSPRQRDLLQTKFKVELRGPRRDE
jgi:hypothetical protein